MSLLPAVVLFLLAPFVSEFLLGDLPITMLPALIVLAPMYGGGALVIREIVRRSKRGWPTLMVLALAYAVLEEAFTTQTLFNPNYMHLNLHLLDHAFIPALGIGSWWTIFVLTLHTVWSIAVSIGLTEGLFPNRADEPWLGRFSFPAVVLVFLCGILATTAITLQIDKQKGDIFIASTGQFVGAAIAVAALMLTAFAIPQRGQSAKLGRRALSPWLVGATSFVATSIFMLVPPSWDWLGVAVFLILDLAMIVLILHQSACAGWGPQHRLALAAGAAMTYAWHAFPQPAVGGEVSLEMDLLSNAVFAVVAVALIVVAALRTRAHYPKAATINT